MLTIVFDLDGTLIDTAPDLISTLNLILAGEGLPALAHDDARRMIGGGILGMIERALVAEGRNPPKPWVDRMFRAFVDHYGAHIAERSRLYPHVDSVLMQLRAEGCRLAVCTNKLEFLSVRLLDALKLDHHFVAICGRDTFGVHKPDPEMLRQTVLRAGGEPGRAIMVGDSGMDVRTARAAAVPVIAVDFGYSEVPIATLDPDRLIGSFAELPTAIAEIEGLGLAKGLVKGNPACCLGEIDRKGPWSPLKRNWNRLRKFANLLDDQGFIRHIATII
jgi:phosphoglycolate phosphatase